MVGPATVDTLTSSDQATRTYIPCDLFTDRLLALLKAAQSDEERPYRPTRRFAWSHHNYADVTRQRKRPPNKGMPGIVKPFIDPGQRNNTNSAALVREYLRYHKWRGWPDTDEANPRLLLTEGGVRRDKLQKSDDENLHGQALEKAHADRLEEMYELMRRSTGIGEGIAMFTQWLFYDKSRDKFDSALLSAVERGGRKRQPAFDRWSALKRYKKTS